MIFCFKGVKIKIGFLFSAVVCVLLCFNTGCEIQFGVLFAVLHETGHLAAIIISGERPSEISFGIFGMTIVRKNDISQNYRQEIITAIAGPAVNFFLAACLYVVYYLSENETVFRALLVNIALGAFNIMPVFGLDGGRAVESALKNHFEQDKAEWFLKIISLFFLTVMTAFGFYILIVSGYNFTFLAITVYLTVMLFVKT